MQERNEIYIKLDEYYLGCNLFEREQAKPYSDLLIDIFIRLLSQYIVYRVLNEEISIELEKIVL